MNFSGTISSDFMKLSNIPVSKRPSLINFAATDFVSLRNSLIDYAKAVYPDDYKYFVESDLGLMFLELTAYMGAVMSMKADMLANENFLATAKQRSSVKKLLELIGVRMRGPLSSAADVKLVFDNSFATNQITPQDRVITVTSPEDGGNLSFTLYKVVNGLVDTANDTGNILFSNTESDDPAGKVYTNFVIQEGALVDEQGEFAATEGVKTVKLSQGPVVEGSIAVFITSPNAATQGAYTEVPNVYYASGSSDKIFEVVYDEDYNATVVFGDGSVGASPEDTASFRVEYRVGGGTRGNLEKDTINASINTARAPGTITNISKATGGANAETIEHAKKYAPLTFRRQDRLVTLEDYAVFANTFISDFGTVGKAAAATRKAYASANIVDIYVLEKASDLQLQRATTNFKTQLLNAINKKKMATDDIAIVDGLIRTLDLAVSIRVDKEEEENQNVIKSKVRDKILTYMSADNRSFGEDLNIAELNRQIFEVDEVRFSTIDNLDQNVPIDFNEIAQLNNLSINIILLD
tara:strand:- start:504 stop:2075 length:1572 start_codon:yes stop_codon:yes gene_type:complete